MRVTLILPRMGKCACRRGVFFNIVFSERRILTLLLFFANNNYIEYYFSIQTDFDTARQYIAGHLNIEM